MFIFMFDSKTIFTHKIKLIWFRATKQKGTKGGSYKRNSHSLFVMFFAEKRVHAVEKVRFSSFDIQCSKCKSNKFLAPIIPRNATRSISAGSKCSSCHVVKHNRLIRNLGELKGKRILKNWHGNLRSDRKSTTVFPLNANRKNIWSEHSFYIYFHIYRLVCYYKLKIKRLYFFAGFFSFELERK